MATVSVLLPVRNGASTIKAALASILGQNHTDLEVIVLDDGSTDLTIGVVNSFDDARVCVYASSGRPGISARLNQGISLATGKYIARMDADDIALPGRFDAQVRFLDEQSDISLVGTRAVVFGAAREVIGLLPYQASHEALCSQPWRGIPLPHPTWMGRVEWFRQHGYREVARAEDQELLLRASSVSRYACLPDVYLAYRQGPFSFGKTLVARKSLFKAQMARFLSQNEWGNALACATTTALKVGVDMVAAIPGLDSAYFARMSEKVPEPVLAQLRAAGVVR
jgi:glycosyltransferase involved in cell wall biosynthesis